MIMIIPAPYMLNDMIRAMPLPACMLKEIEILPTRVNLLALMFFMHKHADSKAQLICFTRSNSDTKIEIDR